LYGNISALHTPALLTKLLTLFYGRKKEFPSFKKKKKKAYLQGLLCPLPQL